jgi:predicted transglutaminase-like cysteine proteinase
VGSHLALYLGASLACALFAAAPARADSVEGARRPGALLLANPGPNMLGTATMNIRADRFNGSWANAMQDASSSPLLQRLVAPARQLTQAQKLAFVQSRVHASIRWISDTTEWGKHDYWATAAQTLAKGAGDMEDRAIVKMHALRALGFNPNDLFLTLARDRVGGPITVLTARLNGKYFILDDTGGTPFLVDNRRNEFDPVLSFGWTSAWVHKRLTPASPIAALSKPLIRRK